MNYIVKKSSQSSTALNLRTPWPLRQPPPAPATQGNSLVCFGTGTAAWRRGAVVGGSGQLSRQHKTMIVCGGGLAQGE